MHISRLDAGHAPLLRTLRLEALRNYPEYFTGTYAEESQYDDAYFANIIGRDEVYGVWNGEALISSAALQPDVRPHNEHKAILWMMYVQSTCQGQGAGQRLLEHIIDDAAQRYEQILLSVESGNQSAVRLYQRLGFTQYGYEPRTAKLPDGRYLDDILMIRFL